MVEPDVSAAASPWNEPPADLFGIVELRLRMLWSACRFLAAAATPWPGLPIRRRLTGLRKGFVPRSVALLSLEKFPGQFLSDFRRTLFSARINGPADHTINNKAAFPLLMKALELPTPHAFGYLVSGSFRSIGQTGSGEVFQVFENLLRTHSQLVIKPIKGMKGKGLVFLGWDGGRFTANGRELSGDRMEELLMRPGRFLVTSFVRQAEYAADLYPRTTNTVRLLTMWDDGAGEAFLAAAAQRIGSSRSFPVDNFRSGRGGLSAEVGPDGVLGPGFMSNEAGLPAWCAVHPETGAPIAGVTIPHWSAAVAQILEGARKLSWAPCLAWDVVWTGEAFQVLELNGSPGVAVHQVHRPLLGSPRVREFYRRHRVIRG